jgi:kynureninase
MQAGMDRLREKSVRLTGYLELLVRQQLSVLGVDIFTPTDPLQRGCQLSLSFRDVKACEEEREKGRDQLDIEPIVHALSQRGVICDARKPNVIRIAPAPLYNSFEDVYHFVNVMKTLLSERM